MNHASTDFSARPAWWLRALGALPDPLLYSMAHCGAWLARRVVRFRLQQVRANLQRCFPAMSAAQLRSTLTRHYREMAETVLELARLATFDAAQLRARVTLHDAALIQRELAAGTPVLLLSAHQGNWEWLLQRVVVEFTAVPFIAAYKPLRNARMGRELLQLRQRFGARLVGAKAMMRQLLRARGPHVTALLADQTPLSSPARIWLDFMGNATAFYPGPGEIARRLGYSAFFLAMRRTSAGHYAVQIQPVASAAEGIDATEFTCRYAALLEAQLRERPWDWAWGHRRWKIPAPAAGV